MIDSTGNNISIWRFMRHTLIALTALITMSSCARFDDSEIWDKLQEHEDRIQKLEEMCSRLNENITALQAVLTALEENDYVTDVVKIMEDGVEIGYAITFAIFEDQTRTTNR